MNKSKTFEIAGKRIKLGERRNVDLVVSQSYSGLPVTVPIYVWRAAEAGPAVFVSGAVHGDELNGTGVVRSLILDPQFELARGTLLLIPVVNMLGYERHARYLPDRRDLNRSFPGSPNGSLAARFANHIFQQVISKCDYGIDLHTAAVRRTNYPNVRADLRNKNVARIAYAFGSELVVNGKGPVGSLRRSATAAKCPTIILEAGEVWKIEPGVVEFGARGVRNVLINLGMAAGEPVKPSYQVRIDKTKWVRAELGGMLQFHVAPGTWVSEDQPLATNYDLFGREQDVLASPVDGVVMGMTTMPSVTPGDPVCHIAIPRKNVDDLRDAEDDGAPQSLHSRIRDDLATSIEVTEPAENSEAG